MPFPDQGFKPFTFKRVKDILPIDGNGVYGIYRDNVCIYVGKGEIRARLLVHLDGDNPCILRENPTHWVDVILQGDPSDREKELILELNPICNEKVG